MCQSCVNRKVQLSVQLSVPAFIAAMQHFFLHGFNVTECFKMTSKLVSLAECHQPVL